MMGISSVPFILLYLENGGKIGDNVKAYMDKHGICYGVETAG